MPATNWFIGHNKKHMHITFDMNKSSNLSDVTSTDQQMKFSNCDFYQLILTHIFIIPKYIQIR